MDERPELFVTLGGQMGVMGLMDDAIEAEAHAAEGRHENAVDLI